MRVVYSHTSRPGGAELAAPALAQYLRAELWLRGDGLVSHRAAARGVRVRLLRARADQRATSLKSKILTALDLLNVQFEMTALLRAEKPAIVISNTIQGILHLALPCALTRTPLVAYVRDLGRNGNRPRSEVFALRTALRLFVKGIVFNSKITRSSWDVDVKSMVVPTAVSEEFYDVWRGEVAAEGVMLGRIAGWKGQCEAISAAELASKTNPLKLTIVGGRLFGDDVELPAHTLPLEVTDHVDAPWDFLRNAGFMIHASLTPEPFGQVVAQAAAAGIPLICSRVGGHMEWLEDGKSCLAVDPQDKAAFAKTIQNVLNKPGDAIVRAQRARVAAEAFRESTVYAPLAKWIDGLETLK